MSNDPVSEGGVPDSVSEWLAEIAEERDVTEQALVERLLSGDGLPTVADAGNEVAELTAQVEELSAAVEALDAELDEKIEDVRERVVQVKREADAKAPHDHDHQELAGALARITESRETLGDDLRDVVTAVDRLEERVEAIEGRMDQGFANFEEVLSYLLETTDDAGENVERLAQATLDLRERTRRLTAATGRRAAADELRESAHRGGVTAAKCEGCGERVHLGLLAAPECPHCAARFVDVEPRHGFLRSSVLRTGERPALEGEVEGETADLEPIVSGDEPDRPSDRGEPAERSPSPESGDRASGAGGGSDDRQGASPGDLTSIAGVGPAYAERLRDAGVETVSQLALADPDLLAGQTDIAPGRVERLVAQAKQYVESG